MRFQHKTHTILGQVVSKSPEKNSFNNCMLQMSTHKHIHIIYKMVTKCSSEIHRLARHLQGQKGHAASQWGDCDQIWSGAD